MVCTRTWFAAIWALRSDMLSWRPLEPEHPGYFAGSWKAWMRACSWNTPLSTILKLLNVAPSSHKCFECGGIEPEKINDSWLMKRGITFKLLCCPCLGKFLRCQHGDLCWQQKKLASLGSDRTQVWWWLSREGVTHLITFSWPADPFILCIFQMFHLL